MLIVKPHFLIITEPTNTKKFGLNTPCILPTAKEEIKVVETL